MSGLAGGHGGNGVALAEGSPHDADGSQPGRVEHRRRLVGTVRPPDGQRRVVPGVAVRRQDVPEQPGREPPDPGPVQVVDHHPEASHAPHLAQGLDGHRRVQVVQDERRVRHIERSIGVAQVPPVADVELHQVGARPRGPRAQRRGEHLRAVVDPDGVEAPSPPDCELRQCDRDVRTPGAHVEQRDLGTMRRQRLHRRRAERHATEPAVDPAQVTEIAVQRRRIVQRPVEQFVGVREALHPGAGYTTRQPPRLGSRAAYHGAMIVVAGEALVDRLVQPDGESTSVPGGGMFNTARTIARLGQRVSFLGALSGDADGRRLRSALADDGVDLSLVETTAAPTTLAIAELDAEGVATYRFDWLGTSAPALSAAAVAAALGTQPWALSVGSLGLALEPMAAAIADGVAGIGPGTLVMLDPNCRPVAIADRSAYLSRLDVVVRRADIVKLSREDLEYLAPGEDATEAARRLLDRGPVAVLLTNGPAAALAFTPAAVVEIAVPPVQVVDTIGAGDAFGGAFLARWVERGFGRAELADEGAIREALGRAVMVASLTCGRPGADPPRRHELP